MNEQIDASQNHCTAAPSVLHLDNNEDSGTQICQATQSAMPTTFKDTIDEVDDTANLSDITVQFEGEPLFGCSTGYHRFDVPMVVLPPTPPKHSHGLSGIKDEFTGMSTPLSVVTEYRPQQ